MRSFVYIFAGVLFVGSLGAEPLTGEQKAAVDAKIAVLKTWATAPEVIKAIEQAPPEWAVGMDQDKWKGLSVLSTEVKELSKNALAGWIRSKKDPAVSEAFVNRADGTKVAFLGKPTNWSHKGKPKHELPMAGKVWQGEVETDESTGVKQVQVALPVVSGGKIVGSIVIGLQLSKL